MMDLLIRNGAVKEDCPFISVQRIDLDRRRGEEVLQPGKNMFHLRSPRKWYGGGARSFLGSCHPAVVSDEVVVEIYKAKEP